MVPETPNTLFGPPKWGPKWGIFGVRDPKSDIRDRDVIDLASQIHEIERFGPPKMVIFDPFWVQNREAWSQPGPRNPFVRQFNGPGGPPGGPSWLS